MAEVSALSNQTIWQPATLTHPISGAQDLRPYDVEMALMADGNPGDGDWFAATWEATADDDGAYLAYAEVGPGGAITLEAGTYRIWLRITLATETPVLAGDYLIVY